MIDRLTDDECKEIMQELLCMHYNKTFAQFIITESKLLRDTGMARLSFPCLDLSSGPAATTKGHKWEDRCVLDDFEAKIFMSGERAIIPKRVNTVYRTLMFGKFGAEYSHKLQNYLDDKINTEYNRLLDERNKELYQVSSGKVLEGTEPQA